MPNKKTMPLNSVRDLNDFQKEKKINPRRIHTALVVKMSFNKDSKQASTKTEDIPESNKNERKQTKLDKQFVHTHIINCLVQNAIST